MVVTVLKIYYTNKSQKSFNTEITGRLKSNGSELNHKELAKIDLHNVELTEFHDDFLSLLNRHAPIRHKPT